MKKLPWMYTFCLFLFIGVMGCEGVFAGRKDCGDLHPCKLPASCASDRHYSHRGCCIVNSTAIAEADARNLCGTLCQQVTKDNHGVDFNHPEVYQCDECTSQWKCVCWNANVDSRC